MDSEGDQKRETFPWRETAPRLAALLAEGPLQCEKGGRGYRGTRGGGVVRFVPPLVLGPPGEIDPRTYLEELPDALGIQVIVLLRAGAAALGRWDEDELTHHKVFKRYVVRGSGKAQITHLKTKGKSRYGSRLRLQNHQRLLEDLAARLREWWGVAPFDRAFHGAPVRLWPQLFEVESAPPFAQRGFSTPLDLHVRAPGFEELLRVRRAILRGRCEWDEPAPPSRDCD